MENVEKTRVEWRLPRLPKKMDRQDVILVVCVFSLLVQIFMCVCAFHMMGVKVDATLDPPKVISTE